MPTATAARADLTIPGAAIGTVAYMSPEQARGEALDARTDLFSLGAVLYEMATGRRAFPGDATAVVFHAILEKIPPSPLQSNPDLPIQLERIIAKALEKDRALRYQSAADLRSDLARLARDRERAPVAAPADRPRARAARRPLAVAGALVSHSPRACSSGRVGPISPIRSIRSPSCPSRTRAAIPKPSI